MEYPEIKRLESKFLYKVDLQNRINVIHEPKNEIKGPVIYWMSRSQRFNDNWSLIHSLQQSNLQKQPIVVVFNLLPSFLGASARHFGFMLRGLKQLHQKFLKHNIPFVLLRGFPEQTIVKYAQDIKSSLIVTDFSPLRIAKQWQKDIKNNLKGSNIKFEQVDSHNVVPVWVASEKQEYMAKTIRPKITNQLQFYLNEFPEIPKIDQQFQFEQPEINWDELINDVLNQNDTVPEVKSILPGEDEAMKALLDQNKGFLTKKRLPKYKDNSNNPTIPLALSGMSPYIHFGQISAQRIALQTKKLKAQTVFKDSAEAFLEQIIIRKELAENFCYYNENYDNINGAYDWAKQTLKAHSKDKRDYLYDQEELEKGKTHDELWNAAQKQMVYTGKMHGFIRMYWAKKILEWTESPETALKIAIYLNDKYELDGRDPNGYVGCMWSICGIHDQGWGERNVFGKIRYMNFQGCKRKFDTFDYIGKVKIEINNETNPFKSQKQSAVSDLFSFSQKKKQQEQQQKQLQKKNSQKKMACEDEEGNEYEENSDYSQDSESSSQISQKKSKKDPKKKIKQKQQELQKKSRDINVKKQLNTKRGL